MSSPIEKKCAQKGIKLTWQRKIVAKVLEKYKDEHLDIDDIYIKAKELDNNISIATVYRNIKLFEENDIVVRRSFAANKSQIEVLDDIPHDHIIDIETSEVIEFFDEELYSKIKDVAKKHNMQIQDYRLDIFCKKIEK